jgi:inner membrane protein involved in colicin E2 resistance
VLITDVRGIKKTAEIDLGEETALFRSGPGGEPEITVQSDWPHPSFDGAFPPDSREISTSGFEATWKILRLARDQIYAVLYLLLRVEDYALLIGSLAAFAMLAAVMFATSSIDWSQGHDPDRPRQRIAE